jgi:toxoflavin biosynthesis protein ToxC
VRPISLREPPTGHGAPITHVAFAPDGHWLASSSYDGSVVIWRHRTTGGVAELAPLTRIRHRRLVNASSWSPEHPGLFATASADKTVGLWRLDPGSGAVEAIGRLARHTDDVNAVAWLRDGERLVTVSEDSTSLLWDARSGRFLGRVTSHAGHCMGVAVSAHGLVLTVGEDGEVFVGDVDRPNGAHRRRFPTSIEGCAWSPDGARAVLACDDGRLRVVSAELDLLEEIEVTGSAARSVAFTSDGSGRLVAGSYDASVRVLRGEAIEASRAGGRQWPRSLDTFGQTVAVGSFGSSPVLLDLEGLEPLSDGGPATHGPNALAASGERIAVGLDSGRIVVINGHDLATGALDAAVLHSVSDDPVLSVAPAPGGWLAGTYAGAVYRLSDAGGCSAPVELGAPVPSLAARPDRALAGTYGGETVCLTLGDGLSGDGLSGDGLSIRSRALRHEGSVKSIAWDAAGWAVSGATDGCVRRFELEAGQDDLLWVHGNLVNAVATDSRGLIASASRDRLVRVGVPGSQPVTLLGPDESVKAVALLGTGRHVVVIAGSYDFACYAWAFEQGEVPDARAGSVVFGADQGISSLLALDATTAVAASWDGSLRLVELVGDRLEPGRPVSIDDLVASAGKERIGA